MRKLLLAALAAFAVVCPARAADEQSVFFFLPSAAVSVTTSATSLASNANQSFVDVCNTDASKTLSVSFSATVTTSTGRPIRPGECIQFDRLIKGQTLYGITTSGTVAAIVTIALPSGR